MAFLMARVCSSAVQNVKAKFSPLYVETKNVSSSQILYRKRETVNKIPTRGTIKHRNLIESSYESLAARDFLRSYKPYTPPPHVKEKVVDACLRVLGTDYTSSIELSKEQKFEILNTCFKEINHSIPNSILHKITTPDDVIKFYETPVSTTTPYDELKNQELPPNLHIQYEYKRFNPDDDSIFGISAFPDSSVIVTGLKCKEKYKGHVARPRPLIDNEKFFRKENVFKCS